MLKAPSLRHRAVALEFHADLPVPVPDQAAGADRLVDIEHDIKAVGNTERGFHLQACAGFRQIAHDTVDNRLMVVEQDARRLERARPRLVPTFHSTPPSTPVSHYRMERSGNRYGDRSNFIKGGVIAWPAPAATSATRAMLGLRLRQRPTEPTAHPEDRRQCHRARARSRRPRWCRYKKLKTHVPAIPGSPGRARSHKAPRRCR